MKSDKIVQEKSRLEKIAENSWYSKGVNYYSIRYRGEILKRFIKDGNCLELGPAEGVMTEILVDYFEKVTCVEGSKIFCENLKNKFPNVNVINSLFEEFDTNEKFDAII
ncbi:MAG: class I SAM-dependent methyltransferase, partial [Spirochaetes bacterium]|nr:class I SAM-dependent methyltransferase [Spirochaetota bacterium]